MTRLVICLGHDLRASLSVLCCIDRRSDRLLARVGILLREELRFGEDITAQLVGLLTRQLSRLFVAAELEQPHQYVAALPGIAGKEFCEFALRQQNRAREAIEIKSDNRLDTSVDQPDAAIFDVGQPIVTIAPLQGRLLRAVPRQHAADPIGLVIGAELEHDSRPRIPVRYQVGGVPLSGAGNFSVQGERDRVEDGRLSRAGWPGDDEEVETGEVDFLPLSEGGEALDLQPKRSHATPAFSTSSSKSDSIASSAGAP